MFRDTGEPHVVGTRHNGASGSLILTNTLGRPWTSDGFRTLWAKACERAGVSGLTFHDLRRTAVVRLAIAGASVPQIAAVTGHSLKDVEAILDAHYLGLDIRLDEAALLKFEAENCKRSTFCRSPKPLNA